VKEEDAVTGFHHEISSRIASVRASLREATAGDDDYLVHVHVGELESLARLAADHGVTVDGLPETLAEHGITHSGPDGQLPGTGAIDLPDR
jgi:hypothetical protein